MLVTWIGLMQVNFPIKSLSDFKVNKDGMIQCQIEGWMHRDEARVIEKTLQGRKNILELGTYQGLSTSIIASFCDSNATITTVEVFEEQQSKAKQNLTSFKNINYVQADSNEWLNKNKTKFDWVFIDHSHETFYMDATLLAIANNLERDHLVLLHDMHLPGVQGQTYKFASMMRIRNLGIGQLW